MTTPRPALCIALLAAAALLAAPAAAIASVLYANDFNAFTSGPDDFLTLNPATGAVLTSMPIADSGGTTIPSISIAALAINPSTGTIYAIDSPIWGSTYGVAARADLITINPANARVTYVGDTGVAGTIEAAAFDPASGAIYAVSATPDRLYRIDPTTGAATLIGSLSIGNPDGIAFDSNGTLYAGAVKNLYTLDKNSGAATLVGTDATLSAYLGLAVRPETGGLYAVDNTTPDRLITVNKTTGLTTVVGSTGKPYIGDIAFMPTPLAPPPPAPTMIAHYEFKEGAASPSALDSSGPPFSDGALGGVSGSPTRMVNGPFGLPALDFERDNGHRVTILDGAGGGELDITGAMTISAIIRRESDAWSDNSSVVSKYSTVSGQRAYDLGITRPHDAAGVPDPNPERPYFIISVDGLFGAGHTIQATGTTILLPDVDYFLTAVFEPGVAVQLYVDGMLEGMTPTSALSIFNSTAAFMIGNRADSTTASAFDGLIGDVRVYGRALSSNEIYGLYASTAGIPEPATILLFGVAAALAARRRRRR